MTDVVELDRRLGPVTLTLYGVGVIVGAGIYVLTGKVAGIVGEAVWLAFLVAAVAAVPTGLSYAALASRHPRSAGEAVYVQRAFGSPRLSFVVGFLVLASGVSSTAAVTHGFANYFGALVSWPDWADPLIMLTFLGALTWINHRGIREATWVNVLCTVTSVGALVVLVVAGASRWADAELLRVSAESASTSATSAVVSAGALAFYAYVGFEDICNVAEEVREPQRTIPRAIVLAMLAVVVLYVTVGITVVVAATPAELAASDVPLALVWERLLPGVPSWGLNVVALFAVTNTALFNLIMASRIAYGMARQGWVPEALGRVHERRRTPTWSVLGVSVLTAIFALTGFLQVLAEATNTIILIVFLAVNVSLIVVVTRGVPPDDPDVAVFRIPLAVPISGAVITLWLVTMFSAGAYLRALAACGVGAALYAAHALGAARRR